MRPSGGKKKAIFHSKWRECLKKSCSQSEVWISDSLKQKLKNVIFETGFSPVVTACFPRTLNGPLILVSLSPSRPQFLGPCCQSADLELSQRMCKQIWENCISASFRYVCEKPLGLRKTIGKTVPVSTSHKACLLLILLQNTRKSTQIPFAWLVPNGIRQGRNVSLDYLIPEL